MSDNNNNINHQGSQGDRDNPRRKNQGQYGKRNNNTNGGWGNGQINCGYSIRPNQGGRTHHNQGNNRNEFKGKKIKTWVVQYKNMARWNTKSCMWIPQRR